MGERIARLQFLCGTHEAPRLGRGLFALLQPLTLVSYPSLGAAFKVAVAAGNRVLCRGPLAHRQPCTTSQESTLEALSRLAPRSTFFIPHLPKRMVLFATLCGLGNPGNPMTASRASFIWELGAWSEALCGIVRRRF